MKTPLIALAIVLAAAAGATAATAQLAGPERPSDTPVVQDVAAATPMVDRSQLKSDRLRVKGDKERLRAARAARDDQAIRTEQATLHADLQTWHVDRQRLGDGTLQR